MPWDRNVHGRLLLNRDRKGVGYMGVDCGESSDSAQSLLAGCYERGNNLRLGICRD
jgi:hypothetical protein